MFQCYFSLLLHPFQPFGSQSWHLKTARWSGVPQTPSDGWVVVFISLWQLGPGGSSRLRLYTNPASASRTAWMAWSKASHKRLVFVHSLSCKADLIIATGSVKLVAKKTGCEKASLRIHTPICHTGLSCSQLLVICASLYMVQRQRSCLAKFGWMSHRFMDLCKLSRQCKFFSYCLGTPLIRWRVANSNHLSHTRNSGCDSNRLTTACGQHIQIPPSYIWHVYTRPTSQWGWYSDYTCYSR